MVRRKRNIHNAGNNAVPKECALNEVFKIIELNQRDISYFDAVWIHLRSLLRNDEVFRELQQGAEFVGDYGLGVKVNQSNVFEFQIQFCLPRSDKLVVTSSDEETVEINIKNVLLDDRCSPSVLATLQGLADKEFYLIPERINKWFQELWMIYIPSSFKFTNGADSFNIIKSKNVSSQLLRITVNEDFGFEVLVFPGIKLQSNQHWISVRSLNKPSYFWTANTWKLKGQPRSFQSSYESIEKAILSQSHLKSALQLLMKIRDKDDLNILDDHDLKDVVLTFAANNNMDSWKGRDTKTVFVAVFQSLLEFLRECRLPLFWEFDHLSIEPENGTGKHKNPLLSHLNKAFRKVKLDDVAWALCNRCERLFYYGIPKKVHYNNRHGKNYNFKNSNLRIPNEMRD